MLTKFLKKGFNRKNLSVYCSLSIGKRILINNQKRNFTSSSLIDNLSTETKDWLNVRFPITRDHLKGKPTIFISIHEFPNAFKFISSISQILENRLNIIAYDNKGCGIDLLRQYVLYYDFKFPLFLNNDIDNHSILTVYDEEGKKQYEYENLNQLFTNFEKDINTLTNEKFIVQFGEFEWQHAEKPLERLMQPQTLLQFPTFLEKANSSIFVSDTHHNRIIKFNAATGGIEDFIGEGKAGYKDGVFKQSRLNRPQGLFYDSSQNLLLVADTQNNAIRSIDLTKKAISTYLEPRPFTIDYKEQSHDPPVNLNRIAQLEDSFQRDDINKIMFTEEFIEKKFILEKEIEFLKTLTPAIPVYYLSCSKAISKPFDLFMDTKENCLYIAEVGYKCIWRVPLDSGMVEDVLPEVIHQYLKSDFTKYVEQVFPSLRNWDNPLKRNHFVGNYYPEFTFLKQRALSLNQGKQMYFYAVDSELSSGWNGNQLFMKQVKVLPKENQQNSDNLLSDDLLTSVSSNVIYKSNHIGYKDGILTSSDEEAKPLFNQPFSIIKSENDLLISDSFNHKLRRVKTSNGQTNSVIFDNLETLGLPTTEHQPILFKDGSFINDYDSRGHGRILKVEPLSFIKGSCLLKLKLSSPKDFKILSLVSPSMISVNFRRHNKKEQGLAFSYIHQPEKFEKEEFEQSNMMDWTKIKRKRRAFSSIPQLCNKLNEHEYLVNVPFEITEEIDGLEMDVNFVVYMSPITSKLNVNLPFKTSETIDTSSYIPFNLQSTHTKNLGKGNLQLEEMETSEIITLYKELHDKLEWEFQQGYYENIKIKEEKHSLNILDNSQSTEQHHETIHFNDSSQILMDYITLRIPIRYPTKQDIQEKKEQVTEGSIFSDFLNHSLKINLTPLSPTFAPHSYKHIHLPTTNNL
ncbi:hypothetical protein ABK040_008614 [Willaertia magna]